MTTTKHFQLKTHRTNGQPTTNEKIGKTLKHTNDAIGNALFGANKKIENGVVGGYKKIEKAFTDKFLEEVPDEPTEGPHKQKQ